MSDLKYTEEHEWVLIEGDTGTVGITDYAQEQLGDIVFVELPEEGKELTRGDDAAVLESVKAASEVYAPLSGSVIEVNEALSNDPALVNSDAQGDGWFFKMSITDAAEVDDLMTEAAYKTYLKTLS